MSSGWSAEPTRPAGTPPPEARADVYRVLVYPNITYARNLEADSYVVVLGAIIRSLAAVRDDLRFTLLLPERVPSLDLPNVEQVPYALPTYPNLMRTHFDAYSFLRAIDWKNRSYDVVWSHLPEHVLQVKNAFRNSTNESPALVGYSHWAELPQNSAYPDPDATMFPANVFGMLAQDYCGVNSEWCKRVLLAEASKLLSPERLARLDEVVAAQYLGDDVPDVGQVEPEPGLLVWNHRISAYTGYPETLRVLDALWERRRDFRVMFTLAKTPVDRPYAVPAGIAEGSEYRRSYVATLARAWLGLGRAGYAPWSVAVMDGLNLGLPYVLPVDACYPEVVGPDYPLLYRDEVELAAAIERVLDDPPFRMQLAAQARADGERFSWANRVGSFSEMFDRTFAQLWTLQSRSARYEDVEKLALAGRSKVEITKTMKWGVDRPFTPYRNRLRVEGIPLIGA